MTRVDAPLELRLVRSRLAKRACFALFLALLALPVLGQLLWSAAEADIAATEMRAANPFPPAPRDAAEAAAWPRRFEAWLNDRLALRQQLVLADTYVRVKWLGQSTSRLVALGRDGYLFYAGERSIEQARGIDRFAPDELDAFVDVLEERRAWLAERGIPLLLVNVPNKERIYRERLPTWATTVREGSRIDQLKERLAERRSTIELLDLEPALREAKSRGQAYYRADTHWTVAAAVEAGYGPIMAWVAGRVPGFEALGPEDLQLRPIIRPGRQLDLARMLGLAAVFREPDAEATITRDLGPIEDAEPAGDGVKTWARPEAPHATRALWYGDSFSVHLLPLLTGTFREFTFAERRNWLFDRDLIEAQKPDVVIYQFAERFLAYAPTGR